MKYAEFVKAERDEEGIQNLINITRGGADQSQNMLVVSYRMKKLSKQVVLVQLWAVLVCHMGQN